MNFTIKRLFFHIIFNSFLFILLIIGIQNSSKKSRINLLINQTIELPISFIIGSSFITGSILGGILTLNIIDMKD